MRGTIVCEDVPFNKVIKSLKQKIDKEGLNFTEINNSNQFDTIYNRLLDMVMQTADQKLKNVKKNFTPKIIWWNIDPKILKNRIATLYQKKISKYTTPQDTLDYRRGKADYKKAIIKAKQEAWTHICKKKTNPIGKVEKPAFENYLHTTMYYHQCFLQMTHPLDKMFWRI